MPDPSTLPRISIITPSFNQGAYIERTIRSVLDQNYPNLEFMILDGGSTDNSVEIIKRYAQHLTYWVSQPDRGQSNAINLGLARATGSILTWLNSDDYYVPGTLDAIAEAALAHPDMGVFVGKGDMIDPTGKVVYQKAPTPVITLETLYTWMDGGNFMQPSAFFRDTAWRAVDPLDEGIHLAFDVDLWMRMAKAGITFLSIDRLLSIATAHPGAKTTAHDHLTTVDIAIAAIRHGGEHAVRHRLEDIAVRLSWAEPNLEKIRNNPLVKLLEPAVRLFMKPAIRQRDTVPRWLRR